MNSLKQKIKGKHCRKRRVGLTHFQLVNFCGSKKLCTNDFVDALPGKKEGKGCPIQTKPGDDE